MANEFTQDILKRRDKMESDLNSLNEQLVCSELCTKQKKERIKVKLEIYQQWKKDNGGVPGIKY